MASYHEKNSREIKKEKTQRRNKKIIEEGERERGKIKDSCHP